MGLTAIAPRQRSGARSHGLCCPPAMTGSAVLLDMAREAGTSVRTGYDVELTASFDLAPSGMARGR